MAETKRLRSIWWLIAGQVVNGSLVVIIPITLSWLGLVHDLTLSAAWILISLGIFMILRTHLQQFATRDHQYHQHGMGFCIITMAAVTSAFSLQMLSKSDLLPGLAGMHIPFLEQTWPENAGTQRLAILGLFFWVATAFGLLTATISRRIESKSPPARPAILAAVNFFLGSIMLAVFVYLLIIRY